MRLAAAALIAGLGACGMPDEGRHLSRDGHSYQQVRLADLIGRDLKDGERFVCHCLALGVVDGGGVVTPEHLLITDVGAWPRKPWLQRGLRAPLGVLDAVADRLETGGCSAASPCPSTVWFIHRARPLSEDRYDLVEIDVAPGP